MKRVRATLLRVPYIPTLTVLVGLLYCLTWFGDHFERPNKPGTYSTGALVAQVKRTNYQTREGAAFATTQLGERYAHYQRDRVRGIHHGYDELADDVFPYLSYLTVSIRYGYVDGNVVAHLISQYRNYIETGPPDTISYPTIELLKRTMVANQLDYNAYKSDPDTSVVWFIKQVLTGKT